MNHFKRFSSKSYLYIYDIPLLHNLDNILHNSVFLTKNCQRENPVKFQTVRDAACHWADNSSLMWTIESEKYIRNLK